MKKIAMIALGVLAGAVVTGTARADLIPTPSFSHHDIPTAVVPSSASSLWELVDVGLLLVALGVASYFALVTRSRRQLLILTVACLIWFGFVRQGCVCPIGATQNVALTLGDISYAIPFGVLAFFVLPLVFTLFFGRTFCAAVCPLGAVQELVAVRTVSVPRWLDHALGLLPHIYLGTAVALAATGTAFLICRYDPFVAFFRLGGDFHMLVFGGSLLLIGLFVGRPYCRYLCPYGAVLGLLSRVSKWHLRIVPGECVQCRLCEEACPYGAIQEPTVPRSAQQRSRDRRQFVALLLATPALIALSAWLGNRWAVPLSNLDPTVRLAYQVQLEEQDASVERTDASQAFRNTGRPLDELYAEAVALQGRFARVGSWLGAWIGLVFGTKLIHLSVRRRRTEYRPEYANCVSCGRCFRSCPVELVRLGLIQDVSEVLEETPA